MSDEVERFIRIQNFDAQAGSGGAWRAVPNCDKLAVWEYLSVLAPNEQTGVDEKRMVFHIHFVEGIRKGSRVSYLGNHFTVLTVSESRRLVGLELCCAPMAPSAPEPMEMRKQSLRR